ncbi:triose-phosphate isomerase [Pseudogemmobacter faecipullorum]|uniref:Triosephosphate isomerase n=1 Tax=Pseudogemmobacter faecipullorum TaxID=2755041 RepID=A0ABS8CJC4_9RHOB|nr:triose-phosphate isomerase [Pseudogemmobacter faecipullorum]MCB5409260.1 triose-phosphate isomerase [Pseudogemmobacter faecipullorum]
MRKLAAGNWKMNGTLAALEEIRALLADHPAPGCDMLICPPATLLAPMAALTAGSALALGGQDCHARASGAHTGDLSAAMLRDAGAAYVILGHSERRADHGESDADVQAKTLAAWQAGLIAVVCIGETEAERDAGKALEIVGQQLAGSLPEGATAANTVLAYEPVWAIGTGRTPTAGQIGEMHGFMRQSLTARFGATAQEMALLYGGSVKPSNAAPIFAIADVDGALVGGASLKAADFGAIVAALSAA